MIVIEVENRSGVDVDEEGACELARRVLAAERIDAGELGLAFVAPKESRALKLRHLGIDEPTDALAFPLDALDELPDELPRQLGDVVVCPQVVGEEWRAPFVHALLHLVGYDHGDEMEAREALHGGVGSSKQPAGVGSAQPSGGVGSTREDAGPAGAGAKR